MYPPAFDYSAPRTLEEALALLGRGDDARVLAGGQSLIPMMKLRVASPARLIDINGIDGLSYIREDNGHVAIGALTRHADMVTSSLVSEQAKLAASAAPWVADPLVRNRGTVCGSVAHCDPEGDWNSVMLASGATVVATSASGTREIPISEFVVDFFTNSLEPGEMVTEIRLPCDPPRTGGSYVKLERKIGDYATVGVAARLSLDGSGVIADAGLALTSVAPINLAVPEAESVLVGEAPGQELFAEAGAIAARSCSPESDVRGPAEFKRAVVAAYTERALTRAWNEAKAG